MAVDQAVGTAAAAAAAAGASFDPGMARVARVVVCVVGYYPINEISLLLLLIT